jgi:hypothetical protein
MQVPAAFCRDRLKPQVQTLLRPYAWRGAPGKTRSKAKGKEDDSPDLRTVCVLKLMSCVVLGFAVSETGIDSNCQPGTVLACAWSPYFGSVLFDMGASLFPSLPFICFVSNSDWPGASACSASSQGANKNRRSCLRCVRQHGVLGICKDAQESGVSIVSNGLLV